MLGGDSIFRASAFSVALTHSNCGPRKEQARLLVGASALSKDASAESLRNVTNQFQENEVLLSDVLQQAAEDQKQSQNYMQALGAYWTARP